MNTEQQFLDLIRADPENPAPRLIFADWLDDEGDPRGEFIRVQCQLERQGLSALEQRWLRERERELLNENEDEWLEPIALTKLRTAQWMFRRGFVEEVAIDAREFVRQGEFLHAAFPFLSAINLRSCNPAAKDLPHCRAWERFTKLQITGNVYRSPLRAETLRTILESEHLGNLRSLNLEGSRLRDEEIRAVAACANLRLWSLNLSENHIDMDALQSLGNSRCARELREFSLGGVRLSMDQLLVLTFSGMSSHLHSLDLRGNRLGSQDNVMALVGLKRFPRLQHLDLRSCGVGDAGLKSLAKSPLWQQLETLILWNNEITDRGVIEMVQAEPPLKLRALELRRNLIGDAGLSALSSSPVLSAISELHLEHNRMEDAGTFQLARSQHAGNLRELHLRGNPSIADRGGTALARAEFPALEVLDLAGTGVGDSTALALAESPASAQLRVLDLGGTRITEAGARALAASGNLGFLEFLDLRMNHLSGDCLVALVERFGRRVLA